MLSSIVLSAGLLLAPFALAEVHNVNVGSSSGALMFDPEAIFASPGDQVVFTFQQKNHSAVQSSFADPCGPKDGGFNSGFFPVDASTTANFPTYTITVNDTQPIWVYCAQAAGTPTSHCGKGMVFAVNCGADGSPNSFTNFKNSALAVGASLSGNASATSSYAYGGSTPAATSDASSPPASTTAAAAAATHTVVVGGSSSLTFNPSEVSAQPNDVVVFQFQSKNHSVTQSSFAAPCEKLGASTGTDGFDSGFMPVQANATTFPTYSITVNNTQPVWAYCRQTGHCGQGMVFALNAADSSTKNFTAFKAAAMAQNGTSSNSTGSGSDSSGSTASGASRTMGAATASLGLVGAVFLLLL
ncbi:uncharacterized protein FOMMEDRAFT_106669 [Fomitiporia mediterranea MF3/22]|uniref:uncharacterized protein n=1 Tax=Fomitiporia mediterranea (strain MF3/22) TaxID=694068 RepID=UPI000440784A|nr:uncharacterized protein FOMMEDRAFT_106669 [Fomitiporia mediterranea MF3/22]EJD04171.1 hypothetical protein FOMMEDRAFT_106669 [Fomitiporia mediterranea MF3/22]